MRWLLACCVLAVSLLGAVRSAEAGIDVRVDLSSQRMTVTVDGVVRHDWAISSARAGYLTPNGSYRPQRLARYWYSRKYGGAMPYAVFFRGGWAIHGTYATAALGRPASHGCIRLLPAHAATLFSLVQASGKGGTRIAITGSRPASATMVAGGKGGKAKLAAARAAGKAGAASAASPGAPGWPPLGFAATPARAGGGLAGWFNDPLHNR